jgi:hypothetical protein
MINRLRAWLNKLTGVVPTQRQEQDFSSELDSHLQLHIDDNLRSGMAPSEARRQAILKLGGIEHTKQAHREGRTFPLLETTLQDIRYALRQLRRSPVTSNTATCALRARHRAGIHLRLCRCRLIKPLPYAKPRARRRRRAISPSPTSPIRTSETGNA